MQNSSGVFVPVSGVFVPVIVSETGAFDPTVVHDMVK
jgi:hypothetical protein